MNALDVARPLIGTRDKTLKCARRRRASRADVEEPSGKSRRPPPRVTISSNPGERSGGFQRGAVCRSRRRRRKVQVAQSCSFNLPAAGLPCYQTRACVGFFSTTTPGPTSLVKSPLTSAACLLTRRVQEYKSNVNLSPPRPPLNFSRDAKISRAADKLFASHPSSPPPPPPDCEIGKSSWILPARLVGVCTT